ncbi:hypothetical protein JW758_01545 [Candidatus Peregrinibacteria bacterium]|nr:hypothetical protein [Candidatus Peregrinibacteria bacterium]
MPINNVKITDQELIEQIVKSHLQENQKTELKSLVKKMTTNERNELVALIKEANEGAEMTKEEKEQMNAINKKYADKLEAAAREESNYVRTEFEKFDKEQDEGEFKELETEMTNGTAISNPPPSNEMGRKTVIKNQKHTMRNITLVTFALIILIGGLVALINIL